MGRPRPRRRHLIEARARREAAHRPRRADLRAGARALLSRARDEQARLFPHRLPEHVFAGRDGVGHRSSIKRDWAKLIAAATITGLRIHDLRHTFASQLVSSGASLPLIGALLGHSNPATTARYAHLFDDPQRAAVERRRAGRGRGQAGGRAGQAEALSALALDGALLFEMKPLKLRILKLGARRPWFFPGRPPLLLLSSGRRLRVAVGASMGWRMRRPPCWCGPRGERRRISLPDGDELVPRRDLADELGVTERTLQKVRMAVTTIANVAYVHRGAALAAYVAARTRNPPGPARRGRRR